MHQQGTLTLEEGQAGVQLPGAVAEGQGVVLGPGVLAGGDSNAVLFQQNCNHLPKTVSALINTLPTPLTHTLQELLPARHHGRGRKDTVLQAQQGSDPLGSWDFRAHAIVYSKDSANVTGRGHTKRRPLGVLPVLRGPRRHSEPVTVTCSVLTACSAACHSALRCQFPLASQDAHQGKPSTQCVEAGLAGGRTVGKPD